MAAMPGVLSVAASRSYELQLDAGPAVIGAPDIWNGVNNLPTRGEGMVIGIIDSGINWEHPFFVDVAEDGFVFSNPRGSQLGLCSNPQVQCNNKLIGVYDFTTEGEQIGRDLNGHGSHVASIAAGNQLTRTLTINGLAPVTLEMAGVAQRANIISYKACQAPDDAPPEHHQAARARPCWMRWIRRSLMVWMCSTFPSAVMCVKIPGYIYAPQGMQDLTEVFLDLRENGLIGVVSAGNSGPGPGSILHRPMARGRLPSAILPTVEHRPRPWSCSSVAPRHRRPTSSVSAPAMAPCCADRSCQRFRQRIVAAARPNWGQPVVTIPVPAIPFRRAPLMVKSWFVIAALTVVSRKGKNLELAGAGGMILANTDAEGESIISDQHCLPAMHVGVAGGEPCALAGFWQWTSRSHQRD